MQPTPPSEEANEEFRRDLGGTHHEPPEAERAAAIGREQESRIDKPRKRGWRFWRQRNT